jgi:hypothetical protein
MVSEQTKQEWLSRATDNLSLEKESVCEFMSILFNKMEVNQQFIKPYASKGFILQGFGSKKLELQTAIKEHFYPDAFVTLRVDGEIAAKRKLPQKRQILAEFEKTKPDATQDESLGNEPFVLSDEKMMQNLMNEYFSSIILE